MSYTTHGHAHIGRVTRTYRSWQNMKKRCYNPLTVRFERWGGRGIIVCGPWLHSFENFLRDMGECPEGYSLDRIDNDGNYTPLNCRWASRSEQVSNSSHAVLLTFEGATKTMTQWAQKLGMSHKTLWHRLKIGWTVERALTQPKRKFLGL